MADFTPEQMSASLELAGKKMVEQTERARQKSQMDDLEQRVSEAEKRLEQIEKFMKDFDTSKTKSK